MMRQILLQLFTALLLGISIPQMLNAQCDFYSDYSTSSGWTQVGSEVEIVNGKVHFLNGAKDREFQKRLHAPLGTTMNENNCWTAQFEFTPTSVGVKNNKPYTGHLLLGVTAGTNDPFFNCTDPPCTGHPPGFQDGILVFYSATNPPTGSLYFHMTVCDSANEDQSLRINALPLGSTNYLRVEKTKPNEIILNVFSDSNFTNHLPGSPILFQYNGSVDGLTHVQHGNIIRGESRRQLTGFLDNLCINWEAALPSSSLHADTTLCPGDSLVLDAGMGAGLNYSWNTGSTDSVIIVKNAGTYIATVSNGCIAATDTIVVHKLDELEPQLSDMTLCENETATLSYQALHATFLWNTGEISSTITPTTSGLYSVTVKNDCETFYDEATVTFVDCECKMELPNVFTPNHDGNNDFFIPITRSENCKIQLQVFNRWGSVVFESNNHDFSWDGNNVPAGTYFWVITYAGPLNSKQTEEGTVTIIK